jgi:hypothetical protein
MKLCPIHRTSLFLSDGWDCSIVLYLFSLQVVSAHHALKERRLQQADELAIGGREMNGEPP